MHVNEYETRVAGWMFAVAIIAAITATSAIIIAAASLARMSNNDSAKEGADRGRTGVVRGRQKSNSFDIRTRRERT